MISLQSLQAQTLTYCEAGANSTSYDEISRVAIGSINNSSTSTAGYENFTNLSTNLAAGASTAMTVEVANAYVYYGYAGNQVIVWIDFNKDGDFTDAGETVYTSVGGSGSFNFTLPADAAPGTTRMRVRVHAPGKTYYYFFILNFTN